MFVRDEIDGSISGKFSVVYFYVFSFGIIIDV